MSDEQTKKRILVVDDNQSMRIVFMSLLTKHGYIVSTAKDGQDALNQLRQESADLVISDVEMPIIDGFTFLRTLRQDEKLARTPVIMMSGKDYENRTQIASNYGAQFLGKPFDLDLMLQMIQNIFANP